MRQAWVDAQRTVEVAVRGVKAMDVDLTRIRKGYEVALRAEPTNPHDSNAIQVVAFYGSRREVEGGGHLLGYLPRDWAAVLRAGRRPCRTGNGPRKQRTAESRTVTEVRCLNARRFSPNGVGSSRLEPR